MGQQQSAAEVREKFLNVELDQLKHVYTRLAEQTTTDTISQKSFCEHFFPSDYELGKRMFEVVSTDNPVEMNFEEFLSLATLTCKGYSDDKISFIFDMFDRNGNGTVDREEMDNMLKSAFFTKANKRLGKEWDEESRKRLVHDAFEKCDLTHDNKLHKIEFAKWAGTSFVIQQMINQFQRDFFYREPKDTSITPPLHVRTQLHIGFTKDGKLDLKNVPKEWQAIFKEANIKKREMKDPVTAEFVLGVLANEISEDSRLHGIVMYDYRGTPNLHTISVRSGEEVRVLNDDVNGGWCYVEAGQGLSFRRGYVPLAYLRIDEQFYSIDGAKTPNLDEMPRRSSMSKSPKLKPAKVTFNSPVYEEKFVKKAKLAKPVETKGTEPVVTPAMVGIEPPTFVLDALEGEEDTDDEEQDKTQRPAAAPNTSNLHVARGAAFANLLKAQKAKLDQVKEDPPKTNASTVTLLDEIRKGVMLKDAMKRGPPQPKTLRGVERQGLCGVLNRAIESRREYLKERQEENDSDDDDSDWEQDW